MKKLVILIALLALSACAASGGGQTQDVSVSPKVQAMCDAEGGCALFTKAAMQAHIEEAFAAGYEAGATAEAKKRGAL
jgi:hypothetical protein